jgi:hypothetical protein
MEKMELNVNWNFSGVIGTEGGKYWEYASREGSGHFSCYWCKVKKC